MGNERHVCGIELPPAAKKTIDLEGRVVKDGVKKALRDRQDALGNRVDTVRAYRKLADSKPLTLQGSDYAKAVEELNKAVERACQTLGRPRILWDVVAAGHVPASGDLRRYALEVPCSGLLMIRPLS